MVKNLFRRLPNNWQFALRNGRKKLDRKMLAFDRVTDWSALRRTTPYRKDLGGRRGSYIDRFYIEKFLATHSESIHGDVAEIQSAEYTIAFGGTQVKSSAIIDANPANSARTLTLDLARPEEAPESAFDCVICTQTLLFVRDYKSAIRSLHKMLRPGGVALVTIPGICPVVRGSLIAGVGEDWWRFTARSAMHDFAEVFGCDQVRVESFGNVLTTTAFLMGLVQEELTLAEMEFHDPDYELIVGICAVRATER